LTNLGFCSSAILISTAHVDTVVPPDAAVARVHVSAQHAANDVAQVRNIVDVGQGAGDQDVSFACNMHMQTTLKQGFDDMVFMQMALI
jgi:hypothetical protein